MLMVNSPLRRLSCSQDTYWFVFWFKRRVGKGVHKSLAMNFDVNIIQYFHPQAGFFIYISAYILD